MKSFQKKFCIIISIFLTFFFIKAHAAYAAVALPLPDITSDLTLSSALTYTVNGTVTVWTGATLTIPAGTHFIFTPGSRIVVNGAVLANGTAQNHIVVEEGDMPPFIPFAEAKAVVIPQDLQSDTATTQTTETQSPEVQTAQVEPVITNTVMMTEETSDNGKHFGFVFKTGSLPSTLSYVDISGALYGGIVEPGSNVTFAHAVFKDCDTGILGTGGTLKLTSTTFDTVQIPVDWDFHGTFTHSDTTFSNSDLKGWRYGGDMLLNEKMFLDSTDGEYEVPFVTAQAGNDIEVSAGVTIHMVDGEPLQIEGGSLAMNGTSIKPVTVYGDGNCPTHGPSVTVTEHGVVTMDHVLFHDLCSGIEGSQASITMNGVAADAISGPFIRAISYSTVTIHNLVAQNLYQVVSMTGVSTLNVTHTSISTINGDDPAFDLDTQITFSITDSAMSDAKTCIAVSDNSALTADHLTLDHCAVAGIASTNDPLPLSPTGIKLTNSQITQSGTALQLDKALVVDVSKNMFSGNGIGVSLSNMPKTTLINNDWGSALGPMIADNPDGDGDSIVFSNVPEVLYRPWIGMGQEDPADPVPPSDPVDTDPDPTQDPDSPEHDPIIIVPGITGSVLTKDYGDKSELWPNISKLTTSPTDSFLNDLELLQAGTPSSLRPVIVGDIVRSIDSVDVFKGLIAKLSQDGYTEGQDLFVLPYDWRLSNTVNQSLLQGAINNALAKTGESKVTIIAHSMGGLLVKDYLARHPDAPVDTVFNIAVPHLGAPKAFKTLMYGDDMGFTFSIGPLQVPLLNSDRTKTISQNMPSVYELLPSKKYLSTIGSYVTDLSHTPSALDSAAIQAMMVAGGRNEKMFPFAQKLHDDTDDLDTPHIKTYDFIGCGSEKTIGGYRITTEQALSIAGLQLIPEYRLSYTDGDGVVPMDSASAANGAINLYVSSGSHGTLPSVPAVQDAIMAALKGEGIQEHNGIGGAGICRTVPGEVVEVHSPVTLDIYDEQGRHVGPLADGSIEYGIPHVQYDTIGSEKFAFLPSGPHYTIINHAQAVGTYDLYVSQFDNYNNLEREEYFHAIPLLTDKAAGKLTVNASGGNYQVQMDGDGDGATDQVIGPSSELQGGNAADITPPVTYYRISDNMMALSASDDTAGVLDTKYSTDGISWKTYTEPFQVTPGMTVYFVSLDKAGNTEAIRHTVIEGDASGSGEIQNPPTVTPTSSGSASGGGGSINTVTADAASAPVISQPVSIPTRHATVHTKNIVRSAQTVAGIVKRVSPDTALAAESSPVLPISRKNIPRKNLLLRKVASIASLVVVLITAIVVLINRGK